jgi:hypothetical protein
MDYKEFKRNIGKAGLNTRSFAKLVGMSSTSVTNYSKADSVPNHLAIIAFLMGELSENHIDFQTKIESLELNAITKRPNAFGKNNKDTDSEKE